MRQVSRRRRLGVALLLGVLVMALAPAAAAVDPGGTFLDDDDSVHEGAIEAVAAEGITKGCNPPDNDLFCPTATVSRAQMASFLVRALGLAPGSGTFDDVGTSVHAADIAALASAGITKGCNPPDNNLFCPDQAVTRGQMASFLVRAFELAPGSEAFDDVGASVHAADIAALASAGITKGCNPPDNTMFCPESAVTREQMATFLMRGLDLTPIEPPDRLPAVSPSPLVTYGTDNWLYYTATVDQPCYSSGSFTRVAAEMTKTAGIVEASGRSYTWFIPPNKVTIHPDTMPTWDGSCAQQNSARLRAALTASNDPERIELWDPMIAASADHMLYPKNDTHWKSAGALIAAERIAERAAPGVWDMAEIDANVEPDRGDLAAFMGIEWPSSDTIFRTALTGVTPTITNEGVTIEDRPVVGYSTAAGHGASTLETVTLHDSTTYALRNQIGPLFEHIVFVPSAEDEIPDDALPYLVDSEQIIVGIVERNVLGHWNRSGFAGSMAAALADDFPHTAATWNPVADGVTFDLPAPAGDSLRYLVLGLDSDTTVTIDTRTSAQLAPDEGAWPDQVVPGTTRYGFELMDGAATLTLPIPTSVTITEAFVITID